MSANMSAPENSFPRGSAFRKVFIVRVLALVVVATIGLGGWMVYCGVAVSLQAEENLHATLFTIRLVEQFVAEHGRWPLSWDELEKVAISQAPPAPMQGKISALRIGGQHGYDWPAASPQIQRRVLIDFHADPQTIAQQPPMSFAAIRPIGAYYEYRDYGFVDSLQATIRKLKQ